VESFVISTTRSFVISIFVITTVISSSSVLDLDLFMNASSKYRYLGSSLYRYNCMIDSAPGHDNVILRSGISPPRRADRAASYAESTEYRVEQ
jgi:hypothetical protein